MLGQRPTTLRATVASVLLIAVALGNTSCAPTIIAMTPYDNRRPAQYKWLYADLAVVGTALTAGSVVYATKKDDQTREDVGKVLLAGAGGWAAMTLLLLAVLRMPGNGTGGWSLASIGVRQVSHGQVGAQPLEGSLPAKWAAPRSGARALCVPVPFPTIAPTLAWSAHGSPAGDNRFRGVRRGQGASEPLPR